MFENFRSKTSNLKKQLAAFTGKLQERITHNIAHDMLKDKIHILTKELKDFEANPHYHQFEYMLMLHKK